MKARVWCAFRATARVARASMVVAGLCYSAVGRWWSEVAAWLRCVFLCRTRPASAPMALEALGANKVPSLAKGTSTILHPSEREPNVPGPVAPAARRPWASRASWRVRHPPNKAAGTRPQSCPAAARNRRQRTTAAPSGRLDSRNRRPAGLPAGSSTRTNKQPKKTLAAKTWRRPHVATRTRSKRRAN